jgi:hypothetical protein
MPEAVAWAGFIGGGEGTRGTPTHRKLRNWQPLARRRHDRSPRRSLTPTAGAVSCPAAVGRDAVDFGGLAVGGRGTDGGPAPAQVSRSDLRVLVRAPPPGTDSPRRRLGPRNRRESCPNDAREAYAEVGVRGTPSPPSATTTPATPLRPGSSRAGTAPSDRVAQLHRRRGAPLTPHGCARCLRCCRRFTPWTLGTRQSVGSRALLHPAELSGSRLLAQGFAAAWLVAGRASRSPWGYEP